MKNAKKTIAGIMAFAMMLSLASCSGGNGESSVSGGESNSSASSQGGDSSSVSAEALASKSFKAIEIDNSNPFFYIENIRPLNDANGEKYFITGSDEEKNVMYIADKDFLNFTPVPFELTAEENADTSYSAVPMKDGTIFVFSSVTTHGDMEAPDYEDENFDYESFDWDAYNESAETTYKVYNIDIEGNVISENELTGIDEYFDEDEKFYIGNPYPVGNGIMVRFGSQDGGEEILVTIGTDGVIGDRIEFENEDDIYNIYTNTLDKDGNFCYVTWGENGSLIRKIDAETFEVSDVMEFNSEEIDYVSSIYQGSGDYNFYVSSSSALYGIKEDGTFEEVINWFDSDLNGDYVNALISAENGEFIMYERNWQSNTNGFYRLTKRDPSELENVQVLTMVVQYEDSDITEKVNQFNKSNDNYRIKMDNYNKYYEWDEETGETLNSPETQLKMDIASGKTFDIICLNGNSALFTNLGKKGALADLYEFMGDGDIKKEDILPNVLEAGELDGKLLSISPSFSVRSLATKQKYCDKENWTIDDMIDTFSKCPDDMRLMRYSMAKGDTFSQFVGLGGFVDYENAKCSFDSDECRKLLEFCNSLEYTEPDYQNMTDEDWQNYQNEIELAIRNDKALLEDVSIYRMREYARYKYATFNNDMCLVGMPSNDGRGALMNSDYNFAIMTNSSNKEASWDFICQFFSDDYQSSDRMYLIPALKSAFTKQLDETMEKPYYLDNEGKKHEYEDSYYMAGEEITVPCLTKAERDELEQYILNAKPKGFMYSDDIYSVVYEEAEAYFNGECSADDALSRIQNRCSIILSEQY